MRDAPHRRPDYAKKADLKHKAWCRNCGKSRYVRPRSGLKPCTGAGPYYEVTCGACGKEFEDFVGGGCNHRPDNPNCLVWQRSSG